MRIVEERRDNRGVREKKEGRSLRVPPARGEPLDRRQTTPEGASSFRTLRICRGHPGGLAQGGPGPTSFRQPAIGQGRPTQEGGAFVRADARHPLREGTKGGEAGRRDRGEVEEAARPEGPRQDIVLHNVVGEDETEQTLEAQIIEL